MTNVELLSILLAFASVLLTVYFGIRQKQKQAAVHSALYHGGSGFVRLTSAKAGFIVRGYQPLDYIVHHSALRVKRGAFALQNKNPPQSLTPATGSAQTNRGERKPLYKIACALSL